MFISDCPDYSNNKFPEKMLLLNSEGKVFLPDSTKIYLDELNKYILTIPNNKDGQIYLNAADKPWTHLKHSPSFEYIDGKPHYKGFEIIYIDMEAEIKKLITKKRNSNYTKPKKKRKK